MLASAAEQLGPIPEKIPEADSQSFNEREAYGESRFLSSQVGGFTWSLGDVIGLHWLCLDDALRDGMGDLLSPLNIHLHGYIHAHYKLRHVATVSPPISQAFALASDY